MKSEKAVQQIGAALVEVYLMKPEMEDAAALNVSTMRNVLMLVLKVFDVGAQSLLDLVSSRQVIIQNQQVAV